MSSVSAKINAISKAASDAIPAIFASISESMTQNRLTEKEMEQLCNMMIQKLPNSPPAVSRAIFSMCDEVLESGSFPQTFPKSLLTVLKTVLGSQKKPMRDAALALAEKLISILTPDVFWEAMSDSLTSKSLFIRESALILINRTLAMDSEFKIGKMRSHIFSFLVDQSPELRQQSLLIVTTLHKKSPEKVEAALKKRFSTRANDIIAKLGGNTGQKGLKKPKETFASISSQPQLSDAEMEAQLVSDFDNPCPDIKANNNPCPFGQLEKMLKRSTDWQDRMQGLEILVAHCRGCQKPELFARDLRSIQDQFVDCLTDARSALCKFACLCLVAVANKLKNSLDQCSDWIIPPLLGKTNHGTAVIALSSGLAVMRYVSAVSGKRIRQILLDFADNGSVDVRVTVVKSMIIAQDKWPPGMSHEFADVLYAKQKDPSEKVRAIVGSLEKTTPISAEDVIMDEKDEAQSQISTTEVPSYEPTKPLPQILEELDVAELVEMIQKANPKPDLIGYMQSVIDVLVVCLNTPEQLESAVTLLQELCANYSHSLYPFLSQILLDLPEDSQHGVLCIGYLTNAFGEFPIATLLRQSKLDYANEFMLKVAEDRPYDIDFQARTVWNVVIHGFYEKCHVAVVFILKKIFEADRLKCESLFASLPANDKNEILQEIKEAIPELYESFNQETDATLSEQLVEQIENAKRGKDINFHLVKQIKDGDSSDLLLGIAAIRECQHFDKQFVAFLMKCTSNRDPTVVSAAVRAMQTISEGNAQCCTLIAESFVCNSAALKCFSRSLMFADHDTAAESLQKLKAFLQDAIEDFNTKYAALDVIAKAVVYIGHEFKNVAGELSQKNAHLLARMIDVEKENNPYK